MHTISCFGIRITLCSQYTVLQNFGEVCLFFAKVHVKLNKGRVFDFKKVCIAYSVNILFHSLGLFPRREYLLLRVGL